MLRARGSRFASAHLADPSSLAASCEWVGISAPDQLPVPRFYQIHAIKTRRQIHAINPSKDQPGRLPRGIRHEGAVSGSSMKRDWMRVVVVRRCRAAWSDRLSSVPR